LDDGTNKLVERWRSGDEQAAAELFHRYARRLTALARSRLDGRFTPRVDAEDVVQSAYRSFFIRLRAGEFEQEGEDWWRLLVTLTLHKLQKQVSRHRRKKRDVRVEKGFGTEDSLFGIQLEVLARDPSPLEALSLVDHLEGLMRELDPFCRKVLELRLRGHSRTEIADQTDRSLRTVARAIEQIKQLLEKRAVDSRQGVAPPPEG
jgi:RNA polymerase sigma factor (sigma-70 family)